jgi:ABC-type transport system involved in multi-copper enzyme maturation permease subunit
MTRNRIIGIILIITAIAMLIIGASLFSYLGPPLNPIVSDIGKYSFLYWLPTLIVGILFFSFSKRKKRLE